MRYSSAKYATGFRAIPVTSDKSVAGAAFQLMTPVLLIGHRSYVTLAECLVRFAAWYLDRVRKRSFEVQVACWMGTGRPGVTPCES